MSLREFPVFFRFLSRAAFAAVATLLLFVPPSFADGTPARDASVLLDGRLDSGEEVYAIVLGDLPRAYVMSDLRKAGPVVHDLVGGQRIDIAVDSTNAGANVHVEAKGAPLAVTGASTWGAWARMHPDTSIWRRAAAAEEGEPRDGRDIHLRGSRDYRTALGCTFGCEAVEGTMSARPQEHPGVFVIAGELTNEAKTPVHHVVLLYELIDDKGKVVFREEGFNRGAEVLAETEQQGRDSPPPAVQPLAPGATDSYRMIFLDRELPPFDHTRVIVSRVY